MRKIVSVLLSVILLLSLVACGESGSLSDSPKADPIDLKILFRGVYDVKEDGDTYIPVRFSDERLDAYADEVHIPYSKCTTGIRLDFYTDATEIAFHFTVTDGHYDGDARYPNDTFDVFEDGEYQKSVDVYQNSEFSYVRKATEESRITIEFPTFHGVALSDIQVGNARPYEDYEHRILIFGDSISQGLFAEKPSDNYINTLCRNLNADYMNLSVGGEKFRPDALDKDVHYDPTHILVVLGTNDWHQKYTVNDIRSNASAYYDRITFYYPDVPVTVITPFEDQGELYVNAYNEAAEKYGCYVIDGRTLLSSTAENLFDEVHPNSYGFSILAENLLPILKDRLGA